MRTLMLATLCAGLIALPETALAQTATVTGRITDAATGQSLGVAPVQAAARLRDSSGTTIETATAASSGVYTIADVAPGTYFLNTSNAGGYVDETSDGNPCISTCGLTRSITLTAGQTLTIDFALDRSSTITGQVTDAARGAPLQGASIDVYDTRQLAVATGVTNAAGMYSIARVSSGGGLAASTYYVIARAAGHVGQAYGGAECSITCRLADGIPVRVAVAQTVGGIDFRLPANGAISGRITHPNGDVAIDAGVSALHRAQNVFKSARTDSAGRYTIVDVAPGSYTVSVGFDPYTFQSIAVDVAAGATAGGIDFTLSRGGGISGRLTIGGAGAIGAIGIYDAGGFPVFTTSSGGTGSYRVVGLKPGVYYVRGGEGSTALPVSRLYPSVPCDYGACVPTTGAPVTVTGTLVTSGIDIDLPKSAQGINGKVTAQDSGTPLAASVSLYSGDQLLTTQSTASDGAYSFTNIAPGAYRVRAAATDHVEEWYDGACALCGQRGSVVSVAADGTAGGIDFTLTPAISISGRITFGTPLGDTSGGFVEALRADGSIVARATPASDGQYVLRELPAGSYYVRAGTRISGGLFAASSSGGRYAWKLFDNVACDGLDCPVTSATAVTVAAGTPAQNIDITLEPGASIEGRIFLEGGTVVLPGTAPSAIPAVHAYTPDGRAVGNTATLFVSTPLFTRYVISGLRPGQYFLKASGARGYADSIYKDLVCPACSPQRGTPVTVTSGERRTGIDMTLVPAGSIAGAARGDADGQPLPGITVTVFSEAGVPAGSAVTGVDGMYTIDRLGSGRYYAATSNVRGFADEIFDDLACGSCDPLRGRAIDVTGGTATGAIDFSLARGALVSGAVRDASGSGAGGATVAIFNAAGSPVASTQTSPHGVYAVSVPAGVSFARVEPGPGLASRLYKDLPCPGGTCDPTEGTPIDAAAGATVSGIDFALPECGVSLLGPNALVTGVTGAAYSAAVPSPDGGTFTYAVQSGTLPPGLTLNATTGRISGTPTVPGRYTFVVGAAGGSGCGTSRTFDLDVTSCSPRLDATTIDSDGRAFTRVLTADAACLARAVANAPWLRIADSSPDQIVIVVEANPAGRRTGMVTVGNRVVTVNQGPAAATNPFGFFDAPLDGAIVSGSLALGGWALDDAKVVSVRILRSPVAGEPQGDRMIGDATIVPGARPDVERAFPEFPYANRSGWGYMLLTNMLPNQGNGTFTLTVVATDVNDSSTTLGTRTIVANNATATQPFGAIDTPQQGETISGASYVNFGWALTPRPKTIPTNGSTISVVIDGATVGTVSYNHFRQDVASLFPGLNNTSGPVGFRTIDTTTLADGLHTIAWVVTDDSGASEGIGSRYFTVANGSAQFTSAVLTPPRLVAAPASALSQEVFARALEPIEIDLSSNEPASCRGVFRGAERVGAEQRALPVGSSLDRDRGAFTWQPGPAFVGTYYLAFDVGRCDGRVDRIEAAVTIR